MKIKTTKKAMRNEYGRIISVGYCDAQYLLRHENEIAYSTRAEGWACDYYDIDGVLISTGYSPLGDKNARHDYQLLKSYDDKARDIATDYSKNFDEQKTEIRALLREFVRAVTEIAE